MRKSLLAVAVLGSAALATPASAAPAGSAAPSCLTAGQGGYYATASNNCAAALPVKAVYDNSTEGNCVQVPAGGTATIGDGLIGGKHLTGVKLCAGTTTVWVHKDAGLGNKITIRGGTAPLSWSAGKDCVNRAADLWECLVVGLPDGAPFEYKVLLNDTTWAAGANATGTGSQEHHLYPAF